MDERAKGTEKVVRDGAEGDLYGMWMGEAEGWVCYSAGRWVKAGFCSFFGKVWPYRHPWLRQGWPFLTQGWP